MNEPLDIANLRYLNESAIHAHALECSAKFRAGKFTRVGSEFVDEVKTDVECLLRDLRAKYPTTLHAPEEPAEGIQFVTGAMLEKVRAELDRAIGRLIQNKVQRQPSVGKTLSRTR